uniref:Leucine zipper putative tumor suppressor 2-like n=1 Tax=Petromyzon marinus TaxID=7757 RepID=A0AAJ7T9C5_PETMA|nr:leucine zipper putative tumor suppressor 2-like [Petromyzon marinus]
MLDEGHVRQLCEDLGRTDYSRWERRTPCGCGRGGAPQRGLRTLPHLRTRRARPSRERGPSKAPDYPLGCLAGSSRELSSTPRPAEHGPQSPSLGPAWPSQAQVLGASCSVLCRHPWVERPPPPPPPPPDIQALCKKMADVKVLEYLAETRQAVVAERRQRIQALEAANERLAQETREAEEAAFRDVNATLAQLQRHQNAQALLEDLHGRQMSEAIANEQRIEDAMRQDVAELERRVQRAGVRLEEARARLRSLRAYHGRDRPLQAARQAQLQRQLQALQQRQEVEEAEAHRQDEEQLERIAAQDALAQEALLLRVAQEHLEDFPHDLQAKSFQNTGLRKEIEIQGKEVVALRLRIPALQREVRQLSAQARKQLHSSPWLLPSNREPAPDEEAELDIPRDEELPF